MKNVIIIFLAICVGVLGFAAFRLYINDNFTGVATGQEYSATTTPFADYWTDRPIKGGWGALGSVVITKAGDTSFMLLNATTSLALSDVATSSVLIASFPASAVAGTYVFDATFTKGLYLDVMSGDNGTSTILFR